MRQSSYVQRQVFPAPQKPIYAPTTHFQAPVQYNFMGYWPDAVDVTASGGAITVDRPGLYRIETESMAASDAVHTILGGSEGMEVILMSASKVRFVHVKCNIGNIYAQANFAMRANDQMRLICDASLNFRGSDGRDLSP